MNCNGKVIITATSPSDDFLRFIVFLYRNCVRLIISSARGIRCVFELGCLNKYEIAVATKYRPKAARKRTKKAEAIEVSISMC